MREQPSDHLETKLSLNWLGPYEVVSQAKNDITVQHVVIELTAVLQVDRTKPSFRSYEDAVAIARHDQQRFAIMDLTALLFFYYFYGSHISGSNTLPVIHSSFIHPNLNP